MPSIADEKILIISLFDRYFILAYGSHVETNVRLCSIYVRVPAIEIGRTTKEGLTAISF